MKKALLIVSCALFMAGMTVSCNNNGNEEVADTIDTTIVDENCTNEETQSCEAEATNNEADAAMLAAAKEAGQAKCNCYKKDAASVEACIRAILSERFAQYKDDDAFKAAMDEEFNRCVKAKVTEAAKETGDKAIKAGAEAISKQLKK